MPGVLSFTIFYRNMPFWMEHKRVSLAVKDLSFLRLLLRKLSYVNPEIALRLPSNYHQIAIRLPSDYLC